MSRFSLFTFFALVSVLVEAKRVSEKIKETIINDIFDKDPHLAATALRFSFHDCIGNLGGCDGCVNFAQSANGGLANIKARLDSIDRSQFRPDGKTVRRADFYVLAGLAAVDFGLRRNPTAHRKKTTVRFRSGRKDLSRCRETRHTTEVFPLSVTDLKSELYGLTDAEAVAILGAHTMGQVNGFRFIAQPNTDHLSFNNNYYKMLLERKMHWRNFPHVTPLSISFGLQDMNRDNVLDAVGVEHRASFLEKTDLHLVKHHPELVRRFAMNEADWLDQYDSATQKIIQRGLMEERHV